MALLALLPLVCVAMDLEGSGCGITRTFLRYQVCAPCHHMRTMTRSLRLWMHPRHALCDAVVTRRVTPMSICVLYCRVCSCARVCVAGASV